MTKNRARLVPSQGVCRELSRTVLVMQMFMEQIM